MDFSKEKFDYVEVLKALESQRNSKALTDFYNHSKEIKKSEVITRLIHRVSLSLRTVPKQFNNCGGNFVNYAGNKIIAIIGEKPSAVSPLKKSYPFLDLGGCSGWINEQLNKTPAREDQLFWINAKNIDDSNNNPEIINQLAPKKIVCLGKIAEKWAKENGWEHISFPRPQYWKRFKSSEPYPLIEFLGNACSKS